MRRIKSSTAIVPFSLGATVGAVTEPSVNLFFIAAMSVAVVFSVVAVSLYVDLFVRLLWCLLLCFCFVVFSLCVSIRPSIVVCFCVCVCLFCCFSLNSSAERVLYIVSVR